jgi:hypothetical protein
MGYCKRSRAPLLAKIARIKLQAISCDSQGTTPLGLAQLEFANIEMYLCESLHRSLMLDWC